MSEAARPLLAPEATAALVLGASDWRAAGLGEAPSFRRSAKGVVAWLYDQRGLGLAPDLVLDLFDSPESAPEQLARIRDTLDSWLRDRRARGEPVADVLLFYVGHGHTDERGVLSLLVRESRRNLEAETGIKAPDLARALRLGAPQQRRLIVLDCCFSEAALAGFVGMSGALSQAVASGAGKAIAEESPGRGTLLLCSSPAGEPSIGAPGAERTLFTGALLDVLREGVPGAGPALSFAALREAAFDRMIAGFGAEAPRPVLHQPDQRAGDLTRLGAFPNRAAGGRPREQQAEGDAPIKKERAAAPPPMDPAAAAYFRGVVAKVLAEKDQSQAKPPGDAGPNATLARGAGGDGSTNPPAPRSHWAWLWWKPKTWRGWALSILAVVVVAGGIQAWIEEQQSVPPLPFMVAAEGMAREQAGDLNGAAERYVVAAAQGDPTALGRLGWFYENGLGGLPRNPQLAVQNYQRAAQQGFAPAQQRLMQLGLRW